MWLLSVLYSCLPTAVSEGGANRPLEHSPAAEQLWHVGKHGQTKAGQHPKAWSQGGHCGIRTDSHQRNFKRLRWIWVTCKACCLESYWFLHTNSDVDAAKDGLRSSSFAHSASNQNALICTSPDRRCSKWHGHGREGNGRAQILFPTVTIGNQAPKPIVAKGTAIVMKGVAEPR